MEIGYCYIVEVYMAALIFFILPDLKQWCLSTLQLCFLLADVYFSPVVCFLLYNLGDMIGRVTTFWVHLVSVKL